MAGEKPGIREAEAGARAAELIGGLVSWLGELLQRFPVGSGRPVRLEADAPSEQLLVLRVVSGSVELRHGGGGLRLRGRAKRPEAIRYRLEEQDDGSLVGYLVIRDAYVTVEAGFSALRLEADSSVAKIKAGEAVLREVLVSADSASVTLRAGLAPGAAFRAELDSSMLSATLVPHGEGDYRVEVVADSSAARVRIEGEKSIIVESVEKSSASVAVAESRVTEEPVRVHVRIVADSSAVKIE